MYRRCLPPLSAIFAITVLVWVGVTCGATNFVVGEAYSENGYSKNDVNYTILKEMLPLIVKEYNGVTYLFYIH